MEETMASNVLPFKAKVSKQSGGLIETLSPKEVHTLSLLIRRVAGELKTEEAEIFEITQRVFGVCDLSHIPTQAIETVTKFLADLSLSSKAGR